MWAGGTGRVRAPSWRMEAGVQEKEVISSRTPCSCQPSLPQPGSWLLALAEVPELAWHRCLPPCQQQQLGSLCLPSSAGCTWEGPQLCPSSLSLCQSQTDFMVKETCPGQPRAPSLPGSRACTKDHSGDARIAHATVGLRQRCWGLPAVGAMDKTHLCSGVHI